MCNVDQNSSGNQPPLETPSQQALRMEARGLILIALVILVVYRMRYFHLVHRSAH
jgi:hypothetical protein